MREGEPIFQSERREHVDPIERLKGQLLIDLLVALPLINQRDRLPPHMVERGELMRQGVIDVCQAHALPYGEIVQQARVILYPPSNIQTA